MRNTLPVLVDGVLESSCMASQHSQQFHVARLAALKHSTRHLVLCYLQPRREDELHNINVTELYSEQKRRRTVMIFHQRLNHVEQ